MKKGGGSESTIIVGPSKSVLVYALHSFEYVLGFARFQVLVPKLYYVEAHAKRASINALEDNIYNSIYSWATSRNVAKCMPKMD